MPEDEKEVAGGVTPEPPEECPAGPVYEFELVDPEETFAWSY